MSIVELPMNPEPHPPVVARVRVMGKEWHLDYLNLPVGTHDLYARQFVYRAPTESEGKYTFTRAEIEKAEKSFESLRDQIRELEIENRRLRNIKLPPVDVDGVVAFSKWYGMPVDSDMDIQTQVAWENWQIAWNAALEHKRHRESIAKVPQ